MQLPSASLNLPRCAGLQRMIGVSVNFNSGLLLWTSMPWHQLESLGRHRPKSPSHSPPSPRPSRHPPSAGPLLWPANPAELLWEPRATGRCEARDAVLTERRHRCVRAAPILFRGCHAFGTSMRRWGCAGRSYPSHSTSRSPAMWREAHCASTSRASNLKAGIGRVLVWACCVCKTFSPNPASSDGKRESRCSRVTLRTG